MNEVALEIIATLGDELQMARDEVQKLKNEIEEMKKQLEEAKDSSAYWFSKYDELTGTATTSATTITEVTPF